MQGTARLLMFIQNVESEEERAFKHACCTMAVIENTRETLKSKLCAEPIGLAASSAGRRVGVKDPLAVPWPLLSVGPMSAKHLHDPEAPGHGPEELTWPADSERALPQDPIYPSFLRLQELHRVLYDGILLMAHTEPAEWSSSRCPKL
ncbi:hypothetical protein NDU88_002614 [Pleurodeles waltl]|uniref:Uncharacterized protein n=1 Tax=Pleurodeles waltl TaxID=8319 RepID=A0AAV7W2W4_PLEWA|nr:hypothetical protein NDU88_002614 [Pleurodeles waltl]